MWLFDKVILEMLKNYYLEIPIDRTNEFNYLSSISYKHGFYDCLKLVETVIKTLENGIYENNENNKEE